MSVTSRQIDETSASVIRAVAGPKETTSEELKIGSEEAARVATEVKETEPPGAKAPPIEETPLSSVDNVPAGEMAAILMEAKTETPKARVYKDDLQELLDATAKPRDREAKPLASSVVRQTMAAIQPRVKRCGYGKAGHVVMKVVVAGATGRVIHASPESRALI